MDDTTTVSAPYIFRGIEYIVTMTVKDGSTLTLEVEDKLTADQWRADFDAAYIEDLTHKTGNFKQFNIFISMLESGIIQASESVSLDLLTYADLESLRQRKSGAPSKSTSLGQRTVTLNSKRYLILTYTVEFDRIHYPLPLPYVGKPDPRLLQEQVRVLRAEIKALKSQTPASSEVKSKDLEKLRKEMDALRKEKDDIENEFLTYRREMKNTNQGTALKELKMFKSMARQLEEELMKEKTKHQRQAAKHGQQYRDLLEELEEIRASERNLRIRVKSLTNELAVYKRDKVGHSSRSSRPYSRDRPSSYDRQSSRERSLSRERERSLSRERSARDRSWSERLSNSRDRSRERPLSANRSRLSDKSNNKNNSYTFRSRTPSPSGGRNPRFDPSAYIKEKERKRQEASMKKKRQQRSNVSGTSVGSSKPSPGLRLANSRLSTDGSAAESDGGISDTGSYTSLSRDRNGHRGRPKSSSRPTDRSAISSAYNSSPDIPKKDRKQNKKKQENITKYPRL